MRQITVSDKVFFALREVSPAVGHDVKAVGEVGDVAVHMVGQKDAFDAAPPDDNKHSPDGVPPVFCSLKYIRHLLICRGRDTKNQLEYSGIYCGLFPDQG